MIQFNLLPDVKLDYIRAKNQKRTIMIVCGLISASTAGLFILLFVTVYVFQKTHLGNVNTDITMYSKRIEQTKDLNKVLTVQNQLSALPDLHNQKPVTSRLFGYLGQLVPAQVNIGKLDVDVDTNAISIGGSTDSLSTVNKFIDTLKFTSFAYGENQSKKDIKPFTEVVLTSFARSDKGATYEIKLKYDKVIFDSATTGTLTVPKIISTRSDTEKPTDLFKDLPVEGGR